MKMKQLATGVLLAGCAALAFGASSAPTTTFNLNFKNSAVQGNWQANTSSLAVAPTNAGNIAKGGTTSITLSPLKPGAGGFVQLIVTGDNGSSQPPFDSVRCTWNITRNPAGIWSINSNGNCGGNPTPKDGGTVTLTAG